MDARDIDQVIVDISNVAGVRRAKGPEWDPIEAVLERVRVVFPRASIYAIADSTLSDGFRYLGPGQRDLELYQAALADKRITAVGEGAEADDTILDQAVRNSSSIIVSNDFYVDKRAEHSWIQGTTDRFFKVDCVTGSDGKMQVSLIPRSMRIFTQSEVAEAAAKKRWERERWEEERALRSAIRDLRGSGKSYSERQRERLLASFGQRLLAYVVDTACAWGVAIVLFSLAGIPQFVGCPEDEQFEGTCSPGTAYFAGAVLLLSFPAYQTAINAMKRSPGRMVARTALVRDHDEHLSSGDLSKMQHPGFGSAIVRTIIGYVGWSFLGLGYLWCLVDANRQTWHDRAAGTIVVRSNS